MLTMTPPNNRVETTRKTARLTRVVQKLTFSKIHLPVLTFFDGSKVNIVFESLQTT